MHKTNTKYLSNKISYYPKKVDYKEQFIDIYLSHLKTTHIEHSLINRLQNLNINIS